MTEDDLDHARELAAAARWYAERERRMRLHPHDPDRLEPEEEREEEGMT